MFKRLILVAAILVAAGCGAAPRVFPVYAHDTRILLRLDYDSDADGVIDVRTYMRNGRAVRVESDVNGDGRVDRWEYYGPSGDLMRTGASTQNDGCQDTWIRVVGDERHVDISTRRDGTVDRREVYRRETLVRAESDSNHDGLADTWEEFESGSMKRLLLDDEKRLGRPTRQIVYGAGGEAHVEEMKENGDASR